MKIEQSKLFDGLGFEELEINGAPCYKGPDGFYYRMDHFASTYVIEYAETEDEARKNIFDDADRFDDDLPETELIERVQEALREYVAG